MVGVRHFFCFRGICLLPGYPLGPEARVVGLTHLHPAVLALGRALVQVGVALVPMGAQATLGKDSPCAWPQPL